MICKLVIQHTLFQRLKPDRNPRDFSINRSGLFTVIFDRACVSYLMRKQL